MKSAWERALEKLDEAGIERPDRDALSADARAQLEDIRSRASSQLAELEILFKKQISETPPNQRPEVEANYRRDRERIESARDSKIDKLRR